MTKAVFLLLLVPALAFAQGQIVFMNNSGTAITNGYTGQRAVTSTRVGFYINPNFSASASSPGWVLIGNTNLFVPGIFLAGTRTLPGFPPGTPVAVQVRAWLSVELYESYEAALASDPSAIFGVSGVMIITPTVPLAPQPTLIHNGLQPFFIGIPEPTTLALAALGLAFLAFGKLAKRRTLASKPDLPPTSEAAFVSERSWTHATPPPASAARAR